MQIRMYCRTSVLRRVRLDGLPLFLTKVRLQKLQVVVENKLLMPKLNKPLWSVQTNECSWSDIIKVSPLCVHFIHFNCPLRDKRRQLG